MSLTKMYQLVGTNLEVEMMSNGFTTLHEGDEKILGVYAPTEAAQKQMVDKIQSLFPKWNVGEIIRTQ